MASAGEASGGEVMVRRVEQGRTAAAAGRPPGPVRSAYAFLVSPRLALALLVVVLGCCVVGVTILRGPRANDLIFGTAWFNGLLVLLATSSAAAFFARIWKRKLTTVSVGMIVFHLSFALLLLGIVYNSLFYFWGVLRLTEGETLRNDRVESYDELERGRLFDMGRLRGATTLVRMHANLKIDGGDKRAAYEIEVGEGSERIRSIIYVTEYLDAGGIRFFCLKEGYSLLVVMSDGGGREIYGAHVPLQSFRQPDGAHLYASGTASAPAGFAFPPPPARPLAEVQVSYQPGRYVERMGAVGFRVRRLGAPILAVDRTGEVPVGGKFEADGLAFSPREVRYWVGMTVRHDPGLPMIQASLWLGLAGMVLTFVGRLRRAGSKRHDDSRDRAAAPLDAYDGARAGMRPAPRLP